MPSYKAPVRDTVFVINELLRLESYGNVLGSDFVSADIVSAVLEEAGKFTSEVLAPLNASGDREGCTRHPDGSVTTPGGFKEAFAQFREAGWGTLSAPAEFGGQGMPHVLGFAFEEFIAAANQGFAMYHGLTNAAISSIRAKASPELQARYLPKMVSNEWLGTMNLTEPHCGTDLGLIRTRAVPIADVHAVAIAICVDGSRHCGVTDRRGAWCDVGLVEAELHAGIDGDAARRLGELTDLLRRHLDQVGAA